MNTRRRMVYYEIPRMLYSLSVPLFHDLDIISSLALLSISSFALLFISSFALLFISSLASLSISSLALLFISSNQVSSTPMPYRSPLSIWSGTWVFVQAAQSLHVWATAGGILYCVTFSGWT